MAKSKRPVDANITAKLIVDIATGETPDPIKDLKGKNPAAVALGRLDESKDLKQRFYYGLPEWFDGGLMKDVYINMIKYENSK